MSGSYSINQRLRILMYVVIAAVVLILAATLVILTHYNAQYSQLLYNVTTASEFNREFKNTIDQRMYYYVIESRYSEGLPVQEITAAQELARSLTATTTQKDSRQAITSVQDLCENLEEKIYQIRDIADYDERQSQLENNIYVLTSLIEEYMYNYLYYEAVQLNAIQQQASEQILTDAVVIAALAALMIAVTLRQSFRLSRSITQPLATLCQRAEEVTQGDLTIRKPIETPVHEIRTMSESMEQMIARLNQQIHEGEQRQARLRKTELALLQAQINPHFLYNTMDTIIWLMEAGKTPEAVEMVSNLSAFFRHSLSKGQDVIPLEEEEQHVRSYLQIQHARYQDILNYTLDIDPALAGVPIPKLTLQPLVENALYHGIKLKRGGGHIHITGTAENGSVVLRVTDDGVGMPQARLDQLCTTIETDERVGFGLAAVHQRLRLQFGPGYGLMLASREGVGTTVTVRIPENREEGRE